MRRLITAMVLTAALSGCATLDDECKPFLGKTKAELLQHWGPAMHTESLGDGNTMMAWSHLNGTRTERVYFYVNSKGIVYYYRWQTRG